MKTLKYILLLFTPIVCLFVIYIAYNYYAPPHAREPYPLKHQDDTLRIAYIGDSWAAMHSNYDSNLAKILTDTIEQPVKVYSFGICGLTSKEIYESFFDDANYKEFMQERGYQYCFISAGINDTYKKMSTKYYQQSMSDIIKFFIANKVRPIILEIPDYDIIKAYIRQKTSRKILRQFSMLLNNTPLDCKSLFRDALNNIFENKEYQHKINIIRYKSWNNNGQKDLKTIYIDDGMHLNAEGYHRLDSVIAKIIIHEYKNR